MTQTVHWLLEVQIREGQLENFKTVLTEMVASTKREQDTHIYEWYFSEDQTTCLISERYRDSAAALAHLDSFGNFAESFLATATPVRFTVLGNPDTRLRESLAGFNPVYFGYETGFCRLS